jgi:lambda family phage portal protein
VPANWLDTPLGQGIAAEAEARVAAAEAEAKAKAKAAVRPQQRQYASARQSRLATIGGSQNSADAELVSGLRNLRGLSRMLVRDASYAKRAKKIVMDNVVGTGIRLQPTVMNTRGTLNTRVNDGIKREFTRWCRADSCHTGGRLHFHDLERLAVGQVFEAGEIFLRLHRRRFGGSKVPLAIEVIEPERIPDGIAQPGAITESESVTVRMGIEIDRYFRPRAYWIRDLHPGDIRAPLGFTEQVYRVEAPDVCHLAVIDRWPQTRGEPWMHAAARKLADMDGYSEAEIIAARGAASYLGTIKSPESPTSLGAEQQEDGSFQMPVEPGMWMRLLPGEEADFVAPNRPNAALDPFMRYMLREFAAGTNVSYESVSRDYSQSNYSSSRLALNEDRDGWRALQQWFIRVFREWLHAEWMAAAATAGAIEELPATMFWQEPEKYTSAKFRPRGWSWIDPEKEVDAYMKARKAGFMSTSKIIALTGDGDDIEDIVEELADENAYFEEKGLVFTTSQEVYVNEHAKKLEVDDGEVKPIEVTPPEPTTPAEPANEPAADDTPARVVSLRPR